MIAVLAGDDVEGLARRVREALATQVAVAPRAEVVRQSLRGRGAIVTVPSLSDAIAFTNEWAAEHLLLVVRDEVRKALEIARMRTGALTRTRRAAREEQRRSAAEANVGALVRFHPEAANLLGPRGGLPRAKGDLTKLARTQR